MQYARKIARLQVTDHRRYAVLELLEVVTDRVHRQSEPGGDLLVGNKANGEINAFDPTTGAFLGTLLNSSGQPIDNPGLWGLAFRSASSGFDPNTLFFTAGIGQVGGNIYTHGLFGAITLVPEPSSAILLGIGMILVCGVRHWRARRVDDQVGD